MRGFMESMLSYFDSKNSDLQLQGKSELGRTSYLSWSALAVVISVLLLGRAAYDWLEDYRTYCMKIILVMIVLLKLLAWRWQCKMKLTYSKTNKIFAEFVAKTEISKLIYRPWIMALNPPAQFFCYMAWEMFTQTFLPPKFRRETFLLPDGGTMGVDWYIDPAGGDDDTNPILILLPGLSGGNDQLYLTSLMRAVSKDYNVGVILFRGAAGLPITSGKFSSLLSACDAKAAIEFVHAKYVRKEGGGKKTRLYVYGCSMGANILGLHLVQQGDKALIDGAIMYGTPWNVHKGSKYFQKQYGGVFAWVVLINLSNLMKEQFKQMKRYIKKEEVDRVEGLLAMDAKSVIPVESTHAFARILGYETLDQYYEAAILGDKIVNIKVPTFGLSAMDDALCDPINIPYEAANTEGSNVMLCTTAAGNHVCHFSGANSDCWGEQWFPEPCKMFLDFLEHRATREVN